MPGGGGEIWNRMTEGQFLAVLGAIGVFTGLLLPWGLRLREGVSPWGLGGDLSGFQFGVIGVFPLLSTFASLIASHARRTRFAMACGLVAFLSAFAVLLAFPVVFRSAWIWATGTECVIPCDAAPAFGFYLTLAGTGFVAWGAFKDLGSLPRGGSNSESARLS